MLKKLLIVGIDPGTTVGYALLDFQGNIIFVGSRKNFSLSSLIKLLIKKGKINFVACDTKEISKFVLSLASKMNATIIKPEINLSLRKKRQIVKSYIKKFNLINHFNYIKSFNKHELSALASAIFAFKKLRRSRKL